jgi:hypothetical protein
MFSGNEWLWILVILSIAGAMAWIAAPRRSTPVTSSSAIVRGTPEKVARDIVEACSRRRGASVHAWPDGIVLLERRSLPGWAVLLAILTFPVGLLALLARDVAAGTIVAVATDGSTTRLHLRGRFDPRDVARINEVITRRSAPLVPGTELLPRA